MEAVQWFLGMKISCKRMIHLEAPNEIQIVQYKLSDNQKTMFKRLFLNVEEEVAMIKWKCNLFKRIISEQL